MTTKRQRIRLAHQIKPGQDETNDDWNSPLVIVLCTKTKPDPVRGTTNTSKSVKYISGWYNIKCWRERGKAIGLVCVVLRSSFWHLFHSDEKEEENIPTVEDFNYLPPLRDFQAINRSSIRKRFRRSDGAPTNQARMSFHLRVGNWRTNQGNRFCKRSRKMKERMDNKGMRLIITDDDDDEAGPEGL